MAATVEHEPGLGFVEVVVAAAAVIVVAVVVEDELIAAAAAASQKPQTPLASPTCFPLLSCCNNIYDPQEMYALSNHN